MPISWDKEARFRLPVSVLDRDDGPLLSQQRVAAPAPRRLRASSPTTSAQRGCATWDAGARRPAGRRRHRGAAMSRSRVEAIANAVLYEGYALYPYRPSSVKNRRRFNFGVLAPAGRRRARGPGLPLAACAPSAWCRATRGTVLSVTRSLPAADATADRRRPAIGRSPEPWLEATERSRRRWPQTTVAASGGRAGDATRTPFALRRPRRGRRESVGRIAVRRWLPRVACRVANTTPLDAGAVAGPQRHAAARLRLDALDPVASPAATFVSLLDPPDEWREAAAGVHQHRRLAGAGRRARAARRHAGLADHPLRLSGGRRREPGRPVRRRRDRRDSHAAHPDADRRGEGRDAARRRAHAAAPRAHRGADARAHDEAARRHARRPRRPRER